jgi:hypothetical protein
MDNFKILEDIKDISLLTNISNPFNQDDEKKFREIYQEHLDLMKQPGYLESRKDSSIGIITVEEFYLLTDDILNPERVYQIKTIYLINQDNVISEIASPQIARNNSEEEGEENEHPSISRFACYHVLPNGKLIEHLIEYQLDLVAAYKNISAIRDVVILAENLNENLSSNHQLNGNKKHKI